MKKSGWIRTGDGVLHYDAGRALTDDLLYADLQVALAAIATPAPRPTHRIEGRHPGHEDWVVLSYARSPAQAEATVKQLASNSRAEYRAIFVG